MTDPTGQIIPRDEHGAEAAPAEPVLLRVHATRFPLLLLLGCFAVELAIFTLDYFVNWARMADDSSIRHIFSTTIEDGLASWASQTQTMLVAATLWLLVVVHRAKRSSWWKIIGWVILAAFFTYMSIDDGAKVHERVGSAIRRAQEDQGNNVKSWFPSYSWQVFILPFFMAMGLYTLGFLWINLHNWRSRVLVLVAIGMFATAVAIDFVEGLERRHEWNIYNKLANALDISEYCREHYRKNGFETVKHFFKSAEECFFEMGANSLLWFLFVRHLIRITGTMTIKFWRGPHGEAVQPIE